MKTARINAHGLEQIAQALDAHHKLGREHFTPAMIGAWASDAERHFTDGDGCYFEIRAMDSATGAPVLVTIPDSGYEVAEISDE